MSWHKRLLDSDPLTRSREWYWSNPETGEAAIQTEWDVSGIIESAKERRLTASSDWKGDVHHVAWVPQFAVDKVWREERINLLTDRERMKKWLVDPENAAFRTKEGRL
jgi:hypothetical protein